jgi:hypothetical protein
VECAVEETEERVSTGVALTVLCLDCADAFERVCTMLAVLMGVV